MTPLDKVPTDWMEHGFTGRLRKHLEQQHELALAKLISAARKSADPFVTRGVAAYDEIGSFLLQLGKVNAHGVDDRDDD